MYEKKLNSTLCFNPKTEGDIIALIEEQANKRGLKEFINRAIRYAVAHADDFDKETEYGYGVDQERTEFFRKYKIGLEELGNQQNEDYKKMIERYEQIEAELEKLYVLAESGRVFGLKQRAELLSIEGLLVKHESERIQRKIWKGSRPLITEAELNGFRGELAERAEDIMVYLIEHYNKELAEFQMALRPMVIETQGAQAQSALVSQGVQQGQKQEPEDRNGAEDRQQELGQEQQELSIPDEAAVTEFTEMFGIDFKF